MTKLTDMLKNAMEQRKTNAVAATKATKADKQSTKAKSQTTKGKVTTRGSSRGS